MSTCTKALPAETTMLWSSAGQDKDTLERRRQRQRYPGAPLAETKVFQSSAIRSEDAEELRRQRQRYLGTPLAETKVLRSSAEDRNVFRSSAGRARVGILEALRAEPNYVFWSFAISLSTLECLQ